MIVPSSKFAMKEDANFIIKTFDMNMILLDGKRKIQKIVLPFPENAVLVIIGHLQVNNHL